MFSVEMLKNIDKHFCTISYLISIIIILNFKDRKADEALGHLNPEMYENTPKTWHHYVRMTIVRFVQSAKYSYTNMKKFQNSIKKWSKLMLQLRFRRIKMHSDLLFSVRKRKIITLVTGQFILHGDEPYHFYLKYDISTRLRLNITFIIIYFSVGPRNCDLEALRIQRDGKKHGLFIFCGHHSPFNFYPYFTKVLIKVKFWIQIPFALNFIFAVMDQYILYSISNLNFLSIRPNLVYKIDHRALVSLFFIQVKKISYVVFCFSHNLFFKYVVYDGPGFATNFFIVNSTMSNTISSSTFQCFIQIPMHAVGVRQLGSLNYTSKNLNEDIAINLTYNTNKMLQLPNTVCLDHVCVVGVNTETGLEINVTLNKIVSEGIYNPTCKYGGIVAGEYLDNEYKESTAVCEKHDGQFEESKSIYSKNSSLILVLYWYNMYQNIAVSLSLSLTRCKPVNIDVCKYNILCSY